MKTRYIFLFIFFISINTFSTQQTSDELIYQGRLRSLRIFPLEKYFKKFPNKRPRNFIQSDMWRGYLATFEIKDNQLLLKDIEIRIRILGNDRKKNTDTIGSVLHGQERLYIMQRKNSTDSVASDLFHYGLSRRKDHTINPDTTVWCSVLDSVFPSQKPIRCDWYSGYIILTNGVRLNNISKSSDIDKFEGYSVIEIDKGVIVNEKKMSNDKYSFFVNKQFKAYKKTEEYKQKGEILKTKFKSKKELDTYLKKTLNCSEKY